MIKAEMLDKSIYLKSHFKYRSLAASVPGGAWDPEMKMWRYPLDLKTCFDLRGAFGDLLRVGVQLDAWARKEIAHRKEIDDLVAGNAVDLSALATDYPELFSAMENRPYQMAGAAWMEKVRSGLLADDPGLGKTLQVMGAAVEAGLAGPIIVFAPKSAALITWPRELRKWLPDDEVTVVSHLPGQRRKSVIGNYLTRARIAYEHGYRSWLICNLEMARIKVPRDPDNKKKTLKDSKGRVVKIYQYPELFHGIKWQGVIVDESQNALITHNPNYWEQTQVRCGLGLLPVADGGLKIAMSGTPTRGKLINFWGTLNWLDPEKYSAYWPWVHQYFQVFEGDMSPEVGDVKEDALEEFYNSLRHIMLRRTKREVAPDLPDKLYAGERLDKQNPLSPPGIWLELDPKQAKMYRDMVANASADLGNGTLIANGVLAEMTRLKQMASSCGHLEVSIDKEGNEHQHFIPELPSNKFDWLVEFLADRGIEKNGTGDSKVVVASHNTKLINTFADELQRLGVESHVLTGETKSADRIRMADAFQEQGGPRVFFLNTKSGGTSLTLDAADDLVLLDETWIPDDQTQVEDRIHRVSRIHKVTIWYLRSRKTLEETIATTAGDREEIQRKLLDGARGVEYAKKLLEDLL